MNVVFHGFVLLIASAAAQSGAEDILPPQVQPIPRHTETDTVINLVLGSGAVVQGVLILLLIMSIATWGIVIGKSLQFRTAKRQTSKFSDVFWGSRNLSQISEASHRMKASPVAMVFAAGYRELTQILKGSKDQHRDVNLFGDLENVDRALKRAKAEELTRVERGTTFLATTASAAPFIGLFGTVWGIMNAFIGLSQVKTSSIQAVAPGISEALIATAIGLAAAIPAAIAYNYFTQQVRVWGRSMDMFSAEFLNIARRHFLK
ncbi:MAG: protein TolQ [Bdellovibrionales bacterium]|nr:protein TolQ [Bdellovibrionales bacterium]